MTYKQILIDYLKDKSLILSTYSKEPYIIKKDLEYIKSLSEDMCRDFLINTLYNFFDCMGCPWCAVNCNCDNCDYAKNHGNWGDNESSYQKMKRHLSNYGHFYGIVSIPDIIDLIAKTEKRVKRLQIKENKMKGKNNAKTK